MKPEHLQSFFRDAGDYSCYLSCLIRMAEDINGERMTLGDIGRAFDKIFDSGCATYTDRNPLDDNFYVRNPERILFILTGKRYSVRIEDRNYKTKNGETAIDFKVLSESNGKKGIGHFMYGEYDPLGESRHARNGYIYSKRIFKEK